MFYEKSHKKVKPNLFSSKYFIFMFSRMSTFVVADARNHNNEKKNTYSKKFVFNKMTRNTPSERILTHSVFLLCRYCYINKSIRT